jgi:AcrR family transcriptional regulator
MRAHTRSVRARRRRRQTTRQRLLEAATVLFAAEGFRRVTVRDICREARANVAAVNYHFRDKMGLYREVIDGAVAGIRELTAEAIRMGEGRPPREKLEAYVRVHCERLFELRRPDVLKPILPLQELIYREMSDPTPALETLMDDAFSPRFEYLAAVVGELMGRPADDVRVVQCATSVHAQVLIFRPSPMVDRLRARVKPAFEVEPVIDHIVAFSLTGIGVYGAGRRA